MSIIRTISFAAALLMLAQFPVAAAFDQAGGPVAIGQTIAQVDPGSNKVAIIQAPAVEPKGGGIVNLAAFGWLQPYAEAIAQGLIALALAWFGKSRYSSMLDESSRGALETFLKNRASSLIADGAVKIQGKAVHVDNEFLFRAASQASLAIPDALKRFGLTPEVVAAKIVDAIPQTQAGAAIIATAHAEEPQAEPVPVTDRAQAKPAAPPPVAEALRFPPTSALA